MMLFPTVTPLLAGMPMFRLTEIAESRVQVISFFLFGFLVCALLFRMCWNYLAKDLERLPKIGYKASLAALVVSGLFTGLVLTMISGARELMTPGAWERTSGSTFRLRSIEDSPETFLDPARRMKISTLRDALLEHAEANEGVFPAGPNSSFITRAQWISPDPAGSPYIYVGDATTLLPPGENADQQAPAPTKALKNPYIIAYEPPAFGPTRFVVYSDGSIKKLKTPELIRIMDRRLKTPRY